MILPDEFMNWAGWQVMKWILGVSILASMLLIVYHLNAKLNAERQIHDTLVTGLKKVLYDTHLTKEQTLDYIEKIIRGEI